MTPKLWWSEGSFCDVLFQPYQPRVLWACPGCSTFRATYSTRSRTQLIPLPAYISKPTWGANPGPRQCQECGHVVISVEEPIPVVDRSERYEAKRLRILLSTKGFGTAEHAALARKLRKLEGLEKP